MNKSAHLFRGIPILDPSISIECTYPSIGHDDHGAHRFTLSRHPHCCSTLRLVIPPSCENTTSCEAFSSTHSIWMAFGLEDVQLLEAVYEALHVGVTMDISINHTNFADITPTPHGTTHKTMRPYHEPAKNR